jgi:hypothetical protein
MDELTKHVLHRLDNLEGELRELRDVTWPVCQARLDGQNSMNNIFQKKTLLRWLDVDEIKKLLRTKGIIMGLTRDQVASELREILVEAHPTDKV